MPFASTIRDEPYARFVVVIHYACTAVRRLIVSYADPRVTSPFASTTNNAVGVLPAEASVFVYTKGTSTDARFARVPFNKPSSLMLEHQTPAPL